jgi:maleate isomerase
MKVRDVLGDRARIGIVVPSTNTIVQPDCDDLRPHGVTNHTGRIPIIERKITTDDVYQDHLRMMSEGIGSAIDLVMTSRPDHVVMGVAIEAFQNGLEGSMKLQAELEERAGVGVSMGAPAMKAALERLGAKRIAVVTPHPPKGDEIVRSYFEEAGFEITNLIGLKCESPHQIAQVTTQRLRDVLIELDGPKVDALVQVGTNLSMMRFAAAAELWLDKPVLSLNAVTYWDALRRCGIEDKVYGFGRILERY